jgi:hypothetical protein
MFSDDPVGEVFTTRSLLNQPVFKARTKMPNNKAAASSDQLDWNERAASSGSSCESYLDLPSLPTQHCDTDE